MDPTTDDAIVIDMPEHHTGTLGGTMRLGKRTTIFKNEDSLLSMCIASCFALCNRFIEYYISYLYYREIIWWKK